MRQLCELLIFLQSQSLAYLRAKLSESLLRVQHPEPMAEAGFPQIRAALQPCRLR